MSKDELGVGLVYWPGLEPLFETGDLGLTSLEVEPEAFWFEANSPSRTLSIDRRALERIAALPQSKVIHGIGAPLGSCRLPDPSHLQAIRESADLLNARWYSEHLAFNRGITSTGNYFAGFLLPPLQTESSAQAIAKTIREVQDRLEMRIAVETGVNYLRMRPWELEDGLFANMVAELADCDLLLDIHNVWTNARNGRQSVQSFLSQLDLSRVREIHLAGGFEYHGFWLDAHSGLVPDDVMTICRNLVPGLPRLCAIHIEILPQFLPTVDMQSLKAQLRECQQIWQVRGRNCEPLTLSRRVASETNSSPQPPPADCSHEVWQDTLASLVAGIPIQITAPWAVELERDPAIPLFVDLARTFRAGIVVQNLKMTSRYLMLEIGKDAYRQLLNNFWQGHCPEPFSASECRAFSAWLRLNGPQFPILSSLIDYDLALMGVTEDDQTRLVRFNCEPMGLLSCLGEGRLPENIEYGDYELELAN
jgi:uncharacterized protein (UPF0276 family)